METKCNDECGLEFGVFDVFSVNCQLEPNHIGEHKHTAKTGSPAHIVTVSWGEVIDDE